MSDAFNCGTAAEASGERCDRCHAPIKHYTPAAHLSISTCANRSRCVIRTSQRSVWMDIVC